MESRVADSPGPALATRIAEVLISREGTGPAWGLEIEEAREGMRALGFGLRLRLQQLQHRHRGAKRALCAMCIGVGQGIALAIERV